MAMNCLIVDDSRVLRTVALRIFEEMRFDVAEAEDGMAALRACHEKMPDLILFDGNLPGMKGVDFLKSVRGQQGGNHPVILVATTESDADTLAPDGFLLLGEAETTEPLAGLFTAAGGDGVYTRSGARMARLAAG